MAFRTTRILASLLPFRSALSDATYNAINTTMVTNSASGKRKNTSKGTTASKRRNLGSDANAQASHTHRPHPRLWKVVDLNSQANPSLCPAFTHTNRFLVSYLLYFAVYCLVVLTDDE